MDVTGGSHNLGIVESPIGYRVRIWGPVPEPRNARALEEWDVSDVANAIEVLEWAESAAVGRDFEVFAVLPDHDAPRWIRIAGVDGDTGGTSATVTYSTD